jgi:DNA-binding NarL/FixJ family response regulator
MDLRMPGGDGVEAIGRLRAEGSDAKIIVLTTYDTDADIIRAVEAGATGYLLKDTPRADLVQAIRAAARGRRCSRPWWPGDWSAGWRAAPRSQTRCRRGRR